MSWGYPELFFSVPWLSSPWENQPRHRRWGRFSSALWLGSLCTSLARGFFLPFLRAAFIATGIAYAIAALYAQQVDTWAYTKATTIPEYLGFIRESAEIFPYSAGMRRAPAIAAARLFGAAPSAVLLPQIEYGLRYDPHSKDLWVHNFIHAGLLSGRYRLIPVTSSEKDTQHD